MNQPIQVNPDIYKWAVVILRDGKSCTIVAPTKPQLRAFWELVAPTGIQIDWKRVQKVRISKRHENQA